MSDPDRDLLLKIKLARLAGYIPIDQDEYAIARSLHSQSFVARDRVMLSGISSESKDRFAFRYTLRADGNKFLGLYGSNVTTVLYRGGSCPVGYDRAGRRCSHADGVFLSEHEEIANYYANRFGGRTPIVERCMLSVHSLKIIDGQGRTSPELGLNGQRKKWINLFDSMKVIDMHMGHLENGNRFMTELHKEFSVPEIATIYIAFNTYDVHSLSAPDIQMEHEPVAAASTSKGTNPLDELTTPSIKL